MKNRLFLVCPDCFLERKIREQFDGEAYFLTALGTVFSPESVEYAEEVNQVMNRNDIEEICIVNDSGCTFHKNVVEKKEGYATRAEEVLRKVFTANPRCFARAGCTREKCTQLARLNIIREALQLKETAYIGNRIESRDVRLKGFVYDRAADRFEEASTTY